MGSVIVKPIVTEKMTMQTEKLSVYGFVVDSKANKIEIKNAIEANYGVNVVSVNTSNYLGKFKRRYTKSGILEGRKNSHKKAIISLKEGESIDFFSNI